MPGYLLFTFESTSSFPITSASIICLPLIKALVNKFVNDFFQSLRQQFWDDLVHSPNQRVWNHSVQLPHFFRNKCDKGGINALLKTTSSMEVLDSGYQLMSDYVPIMTEESHCIAIWFRGFVPCIAIWFSLLEAAIYYIDSGATSHI